LAIWLILIGTVIIVSISAQEMRHHETYSHIWAVLNDRLATFTALVGVGAAVMAWVYRTASVRLGVVDLFGSEITTLCRVGTLVGFIQHCTTAYGRKINPRVKPDTSGAISNKFTSAEEYFPIFSGNSHDLEVLEAEVVQQVTAFYTYMKVVRDYLRQIADFGDGPETEEGLLDWRRAWLNIIYMLFLAMKQLGLR
jgi:hypothetical protein